MLSRPIDAATESLQGRDICSSFSAKMTSNASKRSGKLLLLLESAIMQI